MSNAMLERINQIHARLSELEAKGLSLSDAEKKEVETLDAEFETLAKQQEEAKALQAKVEEKRLKRQNALQAATVASQPASVVSLPVVQSSANEDARKECEIFGKALSGKASTLSSNERAVLETSNPLLSGKGFRVPRSLLPVLLGSAGKALDSTDRYLTPNGWRPELLMSPLPQNYLMDKVQMVPAVSGRVEFPTVVSTAGSPAGTGEFGGATVSWVGEGATKPDTTPTFTQTIINCHELCASTKVTDTLVSRTPLDVVGQVGSLLSGAIRYALDIAILQGTGDANHQPEGILTNASVIELDRETVAKVSWLDLVEIKGAIASYFRQNGMFLLSDAAARYLESQVDNEGRPLFTTSTANGLTTLLAGKQFFELPYGPALGTDGDVVFGDLSGYKLAMETDVMVEVGLDGNDFTKNMRTVKAFMRVGGKPVFPRMFAKLTTA